VMARVEAQGHEVHASTSRPLRGRYAQGERDSGPVGPAGASVPPRESGPVGASPPSREGWPRSSAPSRERNLAGGFAFSGVLTWLARYQRALTVTVVPALAAAALIVYVRLQDGRPSEVALLELASEGNVTMVLQTADGPVVLLGAEEHS
jgi:hypothetical protein